MRALTVRQPYAELIAAGDKTIEVRSRPTSHRGPLAIHSAKALASGLECLCDELPVGCVVAVVDLVGCRELAPEDIPSTMAFDAFDVSGLYAWELANPRRVCPVEWRGQLNLWSLPDSVIEYV